MLDRTVRDTTQLVEAVQFLVEHGAYRDALVTASVWAPRFAGTFTPEQQAQLKLWLDMAEQAEGIEVQRTNRIELDRTDLARLEAALDSLEELHNTDAYAVRDCLCQDASRWRQARDVTDRLRGDLGLRPRVL